MGAWFAKMERQRISERTLAGLARARRAGRIGGRPLKVCDRARIRELRATGVSFGKLAAQFNQPKTTIVRVCA
jgi:DNA invertase Pin-like site-specific DNA recombinase